MNLRAGAISIGDRFTKVGDYSRMVYVADSLVELHGLPPHVRLVRFGGGDGMLMSASALLDPRLWTRVSAERD
jgi:hypothetical protein